jgi:hypothetical protein
VRFVNDLKCCVFPDQWHGVKMQGDRVVELDLRANGLKGAVPDDVGHLTALVKLVLYNNSGIVGEFVLVLIAGRSTSDS